jgi:hypothetical protein
MNMKVTKILKAAIFIVAVLFNATASAYSVGEVEEVCKKPQFREFSLPVYKEPEKTEVAPESEFSFMISPWADPNTITLMAKGQPLDFTVESNSSFHRVKAKLPTALTGNFVRIDTSVKAVLGCGDEDGWLVKVAGS